MDCMIIEVKYKDYTKYTAQDVQNIMPDKPIILDVELLQALGGGLVWL
jgi:hypothetical protein